VNEQLSASIPDDGVRLFLMKNLTRNPEGGYRWKANFEVLYREYSSIMGSDELSIFDKQSLFVKGGNSNYVLPEDEMNIKALFPKAVIKVVEGSGHWVHAEKPKELLDMVRDFLSNAI